MKGLSVFVEAIILIAFVIAASFIVNSFVSDVSESTKRDVEKSGEESVSCGMAAIDIDEDLVSIQYSSPVNCLYKRKFTFDNSFSSDSLKNFTVLLRLDSSRIDYSKTGEGDIRFYDSDLSLLNHEFELWNESGESLIWVRVPQIDRNSDSDHIWAYYNCTDVVNEDKESSWDSSYMMVHHMEETGSVLYDSTSRDNDGEWIDGDFSGSTDVKGKVGLANDFNGNDYVNISDDSNLDLNAFTVELWVKFESVTGHLIQKKRAGQTPDIAKSNYLIQTRTGNRIRAGSGDCNGGYSPGDGPTTVITDVWYYFVYSYNNSGSYQRLYYDGINTNSIYRTINPCDGGTEVIRIGGQADGDNYADAIIDEVRIQNIQRSGDWINATYKNINDEYVIYGSERDSEVGEIRVTLENIGQTKLYGLEISAYNGTGYYTYDTEPNEISAGSKFTIKSDSPSGEILKIRVNTNCPNVYDEVEI